MSRWNDWADDPPQPMFTEAREREIEDSMKNDVEAHDLLALIDAEFRTDPMSVQCFDLRIVERVRRCVQKRANRKGFL